ncbi:unnamed protein product [Cuscuta europaea]|uniref:Uncharacterized protein n=1 Tax=Cuscuta europaea TaxID=41803 RepID=A0A9P0ZLA0_CUSEU|nr:unnamed protein product [Cuscuta europaea]
MEVAVELDDDLFFADISKQISLLIMEDDGDVEPVFAACPSYSFQFQTFPRAHYPVRLPSPSVYLQEQICRREVISSSKGTGVFIPRSSQPTRKHYNNKQGRNTSFSSKSNGQLGNTTKMVSQASPYAHSFHTRKG